jgi:5'-phosphate synthase pdxT subunit
MTGPVIGVLALQGDVIEHVAALEASGAHALDVRTQRHLDAVDALIIPGGESTTVIKLLNRFDLVAPIKARVAAGMPLWGTCMGMIVAARDVAELAQETLDLIDITVRRNAFGRQIASAEVALDIPVLGAGHVMATSFHPELTGDDRVHAYFARVVDAAQRQAAQTR